MVICNKKKSVNLSHKIYKTVIKPTMRHGARGREMEKKDERLMNKTRIRMLRRIKALA